MNERKTLLVADDNKVNRLLLLEILKKDYNVLEATNGREALDFLLEHKDEISVVLLDIGMPVLDGYEVLKVMRNTPELIQVPVIVVTAKDDPNDEIKALDIGADEIVIKPVEPKVIIQRVKNMIGKSEMNRLILENVRLKEQAAAQAEIKYRLEHDSLTGIYSRDIFCEVTSKMLTENPRSNYILVSMDIEKLKLINDLFGRTRGNDILNSIANKLREILPEKGTYARLESDRFAACFSESFFTLEEFQKIINDSVKGCINNFTVVVKFGAYKIKDIDIKIDIMCDRAQMALQTIKGDYSCNFVYYNEQIHEALVLEQKIISDMETALKEKQFVIYLQPIYSLSKMKPISAEVLVRWIHPEFGMIAPGVFIPIFEKNGYVGRLDYYVWEQACRFLANRKKKGKEDISISVNISRYTLYDPELSMKIIKLVKKYNVNPLLLKFEITESAYTDNPKQLVKTMLLLQDYGFKVLMDDFGSGYSSLNLLKNLNVDILKIDMQFLEDFETSSRGGSIFTSVVRMAKWLQIPVIAEGVETKAQLEFLRGVGCDSIQGYYFAEPLPVNEFEEHLKASMEYELDSAPKIREEMEFDELFNGNKMLTRLFNSFVGGIGIYEFSERGLEVIRVNDKYYEIMGYNPQSLFIEGRNILEQIYCEEDKEMLIEGCVKAVEGEKVDDITIRRYHADGETLMWLNISIRHLGGDDEIQILCITTSDVTENKMNEMLLEKQNEDLFKNYSIIQALYNNVMCGISQYTYDEELKILNINDEACRIMGYPNKDALYRKIQQNRLSGEYPEDYNELKEYLLEHLNTGKRVNFEHCYTRGDGKTGWIKGNVDTSIGLDGEKILQCVFIDITASIEHARIIEEIYDNVPCAIIQFMVGEPLKILAYNKATLNIYGYDDGDYFVRDMEENLFRHIYKDDVENAVNLIKGSIEDSQKREFQYRIVRCNGEIIWIQGTVHRAKRISGDEVLEVVFLDVTDTVLRIQQKAKMEELYKLLVEDSEVIIFDYDPLEDKMNYSVYEVDGSRRDEIVSSYLKTLSVNTVIHNEHRNCVIQKIKEACIEPKAGMLECVADFFGIGYRWYRLEYKSIEDENNKVFRFIGRAYDIQEEVESSEALKKRAQTDDLSGLLNRATAREIIDTRMKSANDDKKFAFLLIDIDKFKSINDEFGHPKGDDVIREIANEIKMQFREEDVVARIGGDEFAVLFSTKKTDLFATRKAASLIKKVETLPVNLKFNFPISISVGIAIAPTNGACFDELFEKADRAMYKAKDKGGGCYHIIEQEASS